MRPTWLCATFVVLSFALCASAMYEKGEVIMLNKNNFQQKLASSRLPWLIEVFAPWCQHCVHLAPAYERVATKLKGIANVAAVDGDAERELAGMFGVKGFPTIKLWNGVDFDAKKGPTFEDYNGARDEASIESFVASHLANYVELLASEKKFDDWLVKQSELPHVLLLSDKDKVTPLYKAMSMQFRDRATLAQVNGKTLSAAAERFKVTSFPALLVLKKGSDEPIVMKDKLSAATVNKFIEQHALPAPAGGSTQQQQQQQKQQQQQTKQDKPKPAPAKEEPAHAEIPEIRTPEQFDDACGKKSMGVCFIAVMNPEEEEHARVLAALQAAADKHATRFHYGWLNGIEQESFVKHFALFSGFPSAVAYSPSRKVYAPFVGAWDTDSLHSFLNSVLSSSTRLSQIKSPPIVVERSRSDSSTASSDDSSSPGAAAASAETKATETKEL